MARSDPETRPARTATSHDHALMDTPPPPARPRPGATPAGPASPPGPVAVRRATLADAPALADVHVRAWRETYPGLLSEALLASLSVAEQESAWREILRGPDAAGAWLAEHDRAVVGFVHVRAPQDADAPRPVELGMLYVLAEHHGGGVGHALVDAALGDRPAYLWVARDNPRARRFYARQGFAPDGASKRIERWDDILDIRLVR